MLRVAILDLYEGFANQGMRGIRELVYGFGDHYGIEVELDVFEVRIRQELPGLDYDIYISSGGPGSPIDSKGSEWESKYFNWLHAVEQWNASPNDEPRKYIFFICHSFQLVCRHYGIGNVCERKSTSFGVFPIHMLPDAQNDGVLNGLKDPFYAVDSRDFQVIQPNHARLREMGAKILCIEKARPHVPYERAVMAIRFSDYFFGTQFHPEADAIGMRMYLQTEEKKRTVINSHGEAKWQSMIDHLSDPDKIMFTQAHIIPNFLKIASLHMQVLEPS